MYTDEELGKEFWMLTKGVLQDSTVDTDEARVIKRWLEEHSDGRRFETIVAKLEKFLSDGYIDRFEAKSLVDSIGSVLRILMGA